MTESFEQRMKLLRENLAGMYDNGHMTKWADVDTSVDLDRLQKAHDHEINMVSKAEYARGYEDGKKSKDADHAAVAIRLSHLRFDGGSHENLNKIAYAIYPCATGWTCESSKGLRDRLIDLLGGVHEHRCDTGRGCACGNRDSGDSGEHAKAMTYKPDSQKSPILANSGVVDGGKVTITAEFRKVIEAATKTYEGSWYEMGDADHTICHITEGELTSVADRIDEKFGHIYRQQGAVLQSAISHLIEECNKLHAECDQLRAKLEEADAAIANCREREKSFEESERERNELQKRLDEMREQREHWASEATKMYRLFFPHEEYGMPNEPSEMVVHKINELQAKLDAIREALDGKY